MDFPGLGVTELRELNKTNVIHVLKRGTDEDGWEEEDVAEVMEERGECCDGMFLLVPAQLLQVWFALSI